MSQPPSAAAAADSTQLTAPSDSVQPSPPSKCDPNAPGAAALTCLSDLWRGYLRLLMVHPVRTKAITSAVVSSLSAVIAQKTMGVTLDKLNYTAIGHQALLGLIRGPTVHYWMEALTKLFTALGYRGVAAQSATPVVVGKMLLDQLLFTPSHMLYYMYAIGFLEGRTAAATAVKVSAEFWPLLKMHWRVWPIVSLINFKLVPPQLRVLTLNLVALVWMAFIIKVLASSAAAAAAAAVKK